jgi:hypothetical protein
MKKILIIVYTLTTLIACSKKNSGSNQNQNGPFNAVSLTVNNKTGSQSNVNLMPVIKATFSDAVDRNTVAANVLLQKNNAAVPVNYSYQNNDSTIIIQPATSLSALTTYTVNVSTNVKSVKNINLSSNLKTTFVTQIDSSNKFPLITDSALLTLVQQQTFKYFWDFGDPVSGMARERNSDLTTDATGGTGFGVMSIIVGINRNFITRAEGLARITKIVNFYINNATPYHGAFSHWINGTTGATIPFGTQDNGGDIVETSYLMEGLLCARQYFNSTTDANEINLRANINTLWQGVDWNWYRQSNQNTLYWNWSPNYGFVINVQVGGWCEALITYVLAASSPTNSVPLTVYTNGWAHNGSMVNGNTYYGIKLPLGPANGGPLFFEHYSFEGIDPRALSDQYAKYDSQTINHSKINYQYCVANPHNYVGYSGDCWGLTASDAPAPYYYNASEPNNDISVIAPTAAISSLPYTPLQSMNAIRFFYYKLGDKIWGQYGFYDAFSLQDQWVASSNLAIDQGPQIVMIENYRTGLLWNLFTSCPEVQTGMLNLGFTAPYL